MERKEEIRALRDICNDTTIGMPRLSFGSFVTHSSDWPAPPGITGLNGPLPSATPKNGLNGSKAWVAPHHIGFLEGATWADAPHHLGKEQ